MKLVHTMKARGKVTDPLVFERYIDWPEQIKGF